MAVRILKAILEAVDNASKPIDRVSQSTEKLGKVSKRSEPNVRGFGVSLSKLTLIATGVTAGAYALNQLADAANRAADLSRAFDTLTRRIGGTSETALPKLRQATRNLVSDFDLMKQANNAIILGLPVTEDSMAKLAEQAVILGKAVGLDAASSIESLITGLGRQSKLMLDNLGIVIDVEKAYQDYATTIGKTASDLTDAERKLAFYNATVAAAEEKTRGLTGTVKTLGEQWVSLSNIVKNAVTSILTEINRLPQTVVETGEAVKQTAKDAGTLVSAFGALRQGGVGGLFAAQSVLEGGVTPAMAAAAEEAERLDAGVRQAEKALAAAQAKLVEIQAIRLDPDKFAEFSKQIAENLQKGREEAALLAEILAPFTTETTDLRIGQQQIFENVDMPELLFPGVDEVLADWERFEVEWPPLLYPGIDEVGDRWLSLSDTIKAGMTGEALKGVNQLSNELASAAIYGEANFNSMFKSILAGLAAVIAQALILKALFTAFPALRAAFEVAGLVTKVLPLGQKGAVIPGGVNQPFPMVLHGQEMVLPADLASFIMRQFQQPQAGVASIELKSDIPLVVQRINTGVENGSLRVVASEFGGGRQVR